MLESPIIHLSHILFIIPLKYLLNALLLSNPTPSHHHYLTVDFVVSCLNDYYILNISLPTNLLIIRIVSTTKREIKNMSCAHIKHSVLGFGFRSVINLSETELCHDVKYFLSFLCLETSVPFPWISCRKNQPAVCLEDHTCDDTGSLATL